jgi:N-carbamoyl-L-amino-acid hydrolase
MDDFVNAVDAGGTRLEDVLSSFGIYRENLASLKRDPKTIKAYFELHIEQGPVLESKKKKIGVVTAIAAPSRFRVIFRGQADHSGTTPMEMRKDALVAAGYLITYIDEVCREHAAEDKGRVVGTVGAIKVEPGVINAIPGRTELQVDVRSITASSKRKVAGLIKKRARQIARERGLKVEVLTIRDEEPVALHPRAISLIRTTCEEREIPFEVMPSGAGHDAMQMAKITPTGMIFIPSINGVSHNPTEWTDPADICLGTQLLVETLLRAAHAEI